MEGLQLLRRFMGRQGMVGASLLLMGALAAVPAVAESDHKQTEQTGSEHKSPEIQLISERMIVKGGESAKFHILFQNKTGKLTTQCQLKVKVPVGLTLEDGEGVQWDEANRTAIFLLKNVEVGGARVLHFTLKADVNAKVGTQLPVVVAGISDDNAETAPVNAPISIGTHNNQPLFIGFPDGKFHPTTLMTRAEAAAAVARIKELPAVSASAPVYTDVPASHWAYGYISRAAASGYMAGSAGRFNPDSPLTRGELVVLLLKLRGVEAIPFPAYGGSANNSAANDISTAHELQWVIGDETGQFMPDTPTDRQTAAKLFTVALYRQPLKDGDVPVIQHFPDVAKTVWAFGWVEGLSVVAHESKPDGDMEYLIRYLPDLTHPL
jgi:hypothetical protein